MASPAIASVTNNVTIRSAIDSTTAHNDKDKDDGRSAPTRTVEQTSVLLGQGRWRGASGRLGGIYWDRMGGSLAEKENEANESRGVDVLVMLSSSLLS
jgi:hypothetical protein